MLELQINVMFLIIYTYKNVHIFVDVVKIAKLNYLDLHKPIYL